MKASTYIVKAGWRNYSFLALEFSDGIIGWSEYTISNSLPLVLSKAITELAENIDDASRDDIRGTINQLRLCSRQSVGGIVNQAISAIENALWDAKAKSLNTSVVSLLGGKSKSFRLLVSLWDNTVRAYQHVAKPILQAYDQIDELVEEAVASGVTAIKTNIFIDKPSAYIYMPGFGRQNPNLGGTYMSFQTRDRLSTWLQALSERLPNTIGVALDVNYNYTSGDLMYIQEIANDLKLEWIELDNNNVEGYRAARDKLKHKISTGENFSSLESFVSIAQGGYADIFGIDCQWLGLTRSMCAADVVKEYSCLVAPHNFNGHLSTHIAASFSCLVDNFYLLEYDYDDVPWRDELFSVSGSVVNGVFSFDDSVLGWGAEPRMSSLEKYAI